MDVTHEAPCTQHDKENASMDRSNLSTAKTCKIVLSNDEIKTMASKIRDSVINTSENEIWKNNEGLIECLVRMSFTMKGPKDNVLIKRKISIPLLNSCRKLVKQSTVSTDSKVALRLLRVAVHGIRAIVAAEGENVPKPEAIIKLLYHIISTLDSIAHKKSSVSRIAAYYGVWSFETLGFVLQSCCSDFVVSELSKKVESAFPVPKLQQHRHSLSLSLSKEQLLSIGNHVILACSRIFLLPLWHADYPPLCMEERLLLRCLPVAERLRPHEAIHLSADFIGELGHPWLVRLLELKTDGSLKESIALSRRAHKILWDCVDEHEQMIGPGAVLAFRKQSIDCLLAIIPRQELEMEETEKDLWCKQFASACSQASKAIILLDQLVDTNRIGLKAFLKDIGEELDRASRLLGDDKIGSYIEFCAYRALYGGSMGTQAGIQSKSFVNACIFQYLPYRFQYSGTSKVKNQIDHAVLAVVFLALDVVENIEQGQTLYRNTAVLDYVLCTIRNFEDLVSKDANKSRVGLQVWFKILYKTSLNRIASKAVETKALNENTLSALFLAAQLLHRCCWPLAKAICSTIEGPKKTSVWDFGSDCVLKSISAYQKLHLLQYRVEAMGSCLNEIVSELCSHNTELYLKCQERAAKLFALNGKVQLDQDMNEGAVFSMLRSIRLFMELSRNGVSCKDFQISLRWSAVGSIYSKMSNWEGATVAFVMALMQDAKESTPGPEELTSGHWLAFFKFLVSLSNPFFLAEEVEDERFQSPRRARLVSKVLQCFKEWEKNQGRISLPWVSFTSSMEVIEMLLGKEISTAERPAVPSDDSPRLEDVLSILFRMEDPDFNDSSQSVGHLDRVALLALLHNQVHRNVRCDAHQELLCTARNLFSCLLHDNIQRVIRSTLEPFWGELSCIMLQMNEVCESPQISRSDLSRLISSLGELGRHPKGGWDLLVLSLRLSLRARILMDETLCEPEDFDELMTDASRFSNCIDSCVTAEGSFAQSCATGAMSRLRDYLLINGYELAATFCTVWYKDPSAANIDTLRLWNSSLANMQLSTAHLTLIDFANINPFDSVHQTSDDLAMKASYFLAAVPQARSSIEIRHLKKEFENLLEDSESTSSSNENDARSHDDIIDHWIKSTILLGLAELEEICGDYIPTLNCVKSCFSECNKIAALLVSHIPTDRNEAFQLKALRSQCTVRQIKCLLHLCTVYHLIGDYRRAWGYAEVVLKDFSGLDIASVTLKTSLSDILSILSSQVCRSPLQKLLRRNLITAKIRSSPLDVVVGDMQSILNKEDSPLNLRCGNGEQAVDCQIEDFLDSLLVWDTIGSEFSSAPYEAIQSIEHLSKVGAGSLFGSQLIVKLLQFASCVLEKRQTVRRRPLLDLDLQLRSLECRLHRLPRAKIERDERIFLESTAEDPSLISSLRARALFILGRLYLCATSRNNYDDDATSSDLADVRHHFVSALQSPSTFSEQQIRDIYRCIALASMGDEVSNKSICRFVASSIGRCFGGIAESYTAIYNTALTEVLAVTSELNIEGFDAQSSQTAKVVSDSAFDRLEQVLPPFSKIIMLTLAPTGQLLASSIGSTDGCLAYYAANLSFEPQQGHSFYDEFLKPLDEIIGESHKQLDTAGECNNDDRTSKKVWWELRQKLDSDLMELLIRFERKCCSNPEMQSIFGVYTNERIGDTPCKRLIWRFEEASHDNKGLSQNHEESPSDLKVPELRDELMSYGFEAKRIRKLRKAELVELVTEQRQAIAENIEVADEISQDQEDENETIFLILDENLQRFPFESLPCFRGKSVCRMPSLAFMITMLSQRSLNQSCVDKSNVSYIIDPESNLVATRDRLYPIVSALNKSSGGEQWKGVVGRVPEDGFMEGCFLQTNGLLLYIGHGGGESLLSRSTIAKLSSEENNAARSSVILMGCSSGRLESVNRRNSKSTSQLPIHYEPEGIALSYLLAGAPCVVGNLWDVTDGDIDRYTESLLSSMFNHSGRSIAQCVANARDVCKMKYLVGGAPVCYGLPVFIR